jgi:thiol-disulfide isomerase/thioredoxin
MKSIFVFFILTICINLPGQEPEKENVDGDVIIVQAKTSLVEQLKQFKGKIIYLDFWGTFCGSCIKQFKYKNELDDFFTKHDIISLNICFDVEDKRTIWKRLITDNSVKGYNVFIDSKHIEEYKKNFVLSAKFDGKFGQLFPHYIIIDKQGEITEEYAIWPQEKEMLIEQLIINTK